jgi:hypothetical protein
LGYRSAGSASGYVRCESAGSNSRAYRGRQS